MAAFEQKTCDPGLAGRPLPFRSRESANLRTHDSLRASLKKAKDSPSRTFSGKNGSSFSSANKENVRSWLDSTCPTSALRSSVSMERNVDFAPATPSPVCSLSAASTPLSSPYVSTEQVQRHHHPLTSTSDKFQSNASPTHLHTRFQGKNSEEPKSTSRRNEKGSQNEPPPDSPTGSTFSSGSEGGLLALLASKLLSYKETGRRSSRYARESSGPIDEKHVIEDRSKKPTAEEIYSETGPQMYLHPQDSDIDTLGRNSSLYRTASEAVSELSLGSANGRTLSMEFDAMLAAAVATGIHQASTLDDQQLPEIQEDFSLSDMRAGIGRQDNADARALVRFENEQPTASDGEAGRMIEDSTIMRQGRDSEDMDLNSATSEILVSSRSSVSHGSRRAEAEENNNWQLVPSTIGAHVAAAEIENFSSYRNRESSLESCSYGSSKENSLAMVLATQATSPGDYTTSSPGSSSSQSNEKNVMSIMPIPASQPLEKVRRDKVHAQALAYQNAKSSKCNNRYKREESKITVWENQQKIKASLRMKKVEMKLEQERAKALEIMQNEIARAHKTAEERKASAEAVRAAKAARVAQKANVIRETGKLSSVASVGCFPF